MRWIRCYLVESIAKMAEENERIMWMEENIPSVMDFEGKKLK